MLSLVAPLFEHFKGVDELEQPSDNGGLAPNGIIGICSLEFPMTSAWALESFM